MFMHKVPKGKEDRNLFWIPADAKYRRILPIAPPIPTNVIVFNIEYVILVGVIRHSALLRMTVKGKPHCLGFQK